MAFAIELYFDKAAESKIRAVWSELAAATLAARPLRIGARPHVSILILDSGSRAAVVELFRSLVLVATFPLTFTTADYFDGSDAVIFFKPAVPEALRRLHDVAVKEAQARSLEPRHFGDEWIPHCTCDYGVDANQIAAGLAILSRHVPFEASVEEIGCVEVTSNSVAQIALATMDRTTMLAQLLTTGIEEEDKMGSRIRYRFIQGADPIADITDMLHQSYGPLASRGMRFVASHQDSAETRRRIAKGSTIVAVDDKDRIVGIVTLSEAATTRGCPFYDREDVASFGQFAVRTSHQGRGIGSKLLNLVESLAREHGVAELALDTSEHATELIEMYQAKGFRFVEYAQWKSVNYRSMVFSKTLQ